MQCQAYAQRPIGARGIKKRESGEWVKNSRCWRVRIRGAIHNGRLGLLGAGSNTYSENSAIHNAAGEQVGSK